MNSIITGAPLWFMLEWLMVHLPDELTEYEQRIIEQFYIVFAATHTCGVCRRQFSKILVENLPKFKTRNEACQYILARHDDVNERLHKKRFTSEKGFSFETWMMAWEKRDTTTAFRTAVLDFVTSFCFCFSQTESQEDRRRRCKNICDFLEIAVDVCDILISSSLAIPISKNGIELLLIFLDKLRKSLESMFNGQQYLQAVLTSYELLMPHMMPPWMSQTVQSKLVSHDKMDYFGFLRRYLPVIAVGPVIVSGPNAGQPARPDNDETQNPSGCR